MVNPKSTKLRPISNKVSIVSPIKKDQYGEKKQRIIQHLSRDREDKRTVEEICKSLGVSRGTYFKAKNEYEGDAIKARNYLNEEQMITVHNLIIEKQLNKTPIKIKDVLKMSQDVSGRGGPQPTMSWYYNTFKKHPINACLKVRKGSKTSIDRTNVNTKEVKEWVPIQQEMLLKNGIDLYGMVNVDETNCIINDTSSKYLINPKFGSAKLHKVQNKQHITLISCITASGHALPPYIIIKAPTSSLEGKTLKIESGYVTYNSSGWVDANAKAHFIGWMATKLKEMFGERKYILYVDNHSSNLQTIVATELKNNGIDAFTFPANSTHLLQPLDLGVFSPFKSAINQVTHKVRSRIQEKDSNAQFTDQNYVDVIKEAWQVTSTQSNILSAWKKLSFDYDLIENSAKTRNSLQIVPVNNQSSEIVLSNAESTQNDPLSKQRKVGVHITSSGAMNQFAFTEQRRPRGRPKKVNNLILIQNNQTNNFVTNNNVVLSNVVPNSVAPPKMLQLAPPKPKRKYTKRVKPVLPPNDSSSELD